MFCENSDRLARVIDVLRLLVVPVSELKTSVQGQIKPLKAENTCNHWTKIQPPSSKRPDSFSITKSRRLAPYCKVARSGRILKTFQYPLTLILLRWIIWWAPNNARKWRMGFKSTFKGLKSKSNVDLNYI